MRALAVIISHVFCLIIFVAFILMQVKLFPNFVSIPINHYLLILQVTNCTLNHRFFTCFISAENSTQNYFGLTP